MCMWSTEHAELINFVFQFCVTHRVGMEHACGTTPAAAVLDTVDQHAVTKVCPCSTVPWDINFGSDLFAYLLQNS